MQKSPLFRKENTTAHRPHVRVGGDYRDQRNTKKEATADPKRSSMHGKEHRGRDYTPLFKFLLSRVGQPWNEVHSEAVSRLDRVEPIFWLVAVTESGRREFVRVGESSYYSGLYIDDGGRLQQVNPELGPSSLAPSCKCCTHTFNGIRFTQPFRLSESSVDPGPIDFGF
jgi:hypothetical protein